VNGLRAGKTNGKFIAAIFLLTLGGVGLYLGSHNHMFRSLGVLSVVAATYIIRPTTVRSNSPIAPNGDVTLKAKGPGPLLWGISLALVPLLGVALLLVQNDAAAGGHEAWPVDVLFGVILVCCIVWALLTTQIMNRRR
jgi:hypothetical protein